MLRHTVITKLILLFMILLQTGYAAETSMPSDVNNLTYDSQGLQDGEVYAVIIPTHEADISSSINATISKIYFSPGEKFKKGDVILSFDCQDVEIEIRKAKSELKLSQTTYKSNLKLSQLKSISDIELETSKTEYDKSIAEVDSLKHKLSKCKILAPYDGEVISKSANENENVKIDDPLFSIVSYKSFEVHMFIPSVWLSWLKRGETFILQLQEIEQPLSAKVDKIAARVDPASHSVSIYGKISQAPENLLAGMSGVAKFEKQKKMEK